MQAAMFAGAQSGPHELPGVAREWRGVPARMNATRCLSRLGLRSPVNAYSAAADSEAAQPPFPDLRFALSISLSMKRLSTVNVSDTALCKCGNPLLDFHISTRSVSPPTITS